MNELLIEVKKYQSEKRFQHTLGVVATAERLATIYNVNIEQCKVASILHDITKQFNIDDQNHLLTKVADETIINTKQLWHAYTGAIYVKQNLDINDNVILEAIKYHTTGHKNSSDVAKVLYISDFIEPNRTGDYLKKFRNQVGQISLDEFYNDIALYKINYELNSGHKLHKHTKELYESIVQNNPALH